MSDYILRGTKKLISYAVSQGVDMKNGRDRLAAAVGLPRIHFAGAGRDGSAYISPRYTEAKAQALAGIIGTSVANVTTNGGQEIVG